MKKKIAFYTPHLDITGGPVSLYDYAHHNEEILGNESIIIHDDKWFNDGNPIGHHSEVVKKFYNRFKNIHTLKGPDGFRWHWNSTYVNPLLEEVLETENCDYVFICKLGVNDGIVSKRSKTLVQCVGTHCEPHGDVYSYASEWLSQVASGGRYPAVPFMVSPLPKISDNLREILQIPEDAIVFGRIGGIGSWSDVPALSYVSGLTIEVARRNPNVYFIFMNTPEFTNHPQFRFLPASSDYLDKSLFINSCDAMLHARSHGEGFGLSCGEFASLNKPIITYGGSPEKFHIELVKKYGGYLYFTPQDLFTILMSFKKDPTRDWNIYRDYTPEIIMEKFEKIYLN